MSQKLRVLFLALFDYKSLCFKLDFFFHFLCNLLQENLVDQDLYYLLTHLVPGRFSLVVDHVVLFEKLSQVSKLRLSQTDLGRDEISLFALLDV